MKFQSRVPTEDAHILSRSNYSSNKLSGMFQRAMAVSYRFHNRVAQVCTWKENDFVKLSKNLDRYRSENNCVESLKYIGNSSMM